MMETWVSSVPVVAAVVGAFIAVVQFLFNWWQKKKLAKLLKVFSTLDTDSSGTISYSELKAGLEKRGFGDDEIRTMFAALDLNQYVF
jgi:Ca2+-binding EF-hand superfamily protein